MARAGFKRSDRNKDVATRMRGLKNSLGAKKGHLDRFYHSGGLALVWHILLKYQSWVDSATYAALLEMALVGDEDVFGWHGETLGEEKSSRLRFRPTPPSPAHALSLQLNQYLCLRM